VSGIFRSLNWAGRLGIHRPFQMSGDAKVEGNDEILNGPVRKAIENYLRDMGVRVKYVELMYSVPSSQLRQVTQEEIDEDLLGFTPDLKDLIGAKCGRQPTPSSAEKPDSTAARQASEAVACRAQFESRLRAELPSQGWQKVYGRK
jgi:hypothetical protein